MGIANLWATVRTIALKRLNQIQNWTKPASGSLVLSTAEDLLRSKEELLEENLLLRQQLIVLKRRTKRSKFTWRDRLPVNESVKNVEVIDVLDYQPKRVPSKTWRECIKKVLEVDPLQCPQCLHEMRIVTIINEQLIVEKILKHLDLWQPQAHSPPVNDETRIVEEATYDYSFFDYLPA